MSDCLFRTLEHNSVCAGGGAVEAALSVYLDDFARTLVICHVIFKDQLYTVCSVLEF